MKRWSLPFLILAGLAPLALPAQIASRVVRARVAGLDLISYHTGVEEIISIHGAFPAGDAFSPPDNPSVATVVAGMLDKGTTRQDKFQLAEKLKRVGASIQFGAGNYDATFTARCL